MKSFIQPGEILDHTPGSALSSGDVVIIGTLVTVACSDIAANTLGAVATEGVFSLPKKAGSAITKGAKLTWSVADTAFTTGAGVTGDTLGGAVAAAAAASGDTSMSVLLCPGTGSTV